MFLLIYTVNLIKIASWYCLDNMAYIGLELPSTSLPVTRWSPLRSRTIKSRGFFCFFNKVLNRMSVFLIVLLNF